MYTVDFTTLAAADVRHACAWNREQQSGLEELCLRALHTRIIEIARHPEACQVRYRDVRKAIVKRFPYAVYYKLSTRHRMVVIAVQHMQQDEGKWKRRKR